MKRPTATLAPKLFPLVAALVLAGCGAGAEAPQMPPQPVSVAAVVERSVTEWDEFTGRLEAVDTVEIRPRVTGYLAAIHFDEGAEVKKGDLLFTIDDREHVAAYARARAEVDRAKTRIALAKREIERARKLVAARAISQEEFDTRDAERRQAEADLAAMQAQATMALIKVDYTRIVSPIDGRVGRAEVTVGNLVTDGAPEATHLATVVSLDPMYVWFEGDENIYLRYQERARDGSRPSSRDVANPVKLGLANEEGHPHDGVMDFVDNRIDPGTGTIRARAVFENDDRVFTPGMFARLKLLGSGSYPATLIHDRAVLTDQDRKYVYVVGENSTAQRRDVVLGREIDGLRVVTKGLEAGELVVVNGVQKIFFPGMPIAPSTVPMDQPELAPKPAQGAPAVAQASE